MSSETLKIVIDAQQIVSTLQINIQYIKVVTESGTSTDISLDIYNHEDRRFITGLIDTLKLFYTDTSLTNNNRADLISHELQNELVIPKNDVNVGTSYFCQLFAYKNNLPVVISNRTNVLEIKEVIDPSFSLLGMDKMIQVRFSKEHIESVLDISENQDVFAFMFSVNERSQDILKTNIKIKDDLSYNNTDEYYYYNIEKNVVQNYTIINGDIYEVTIGYTNYLGDSNIISKNVVPSLIFNKPRDVNVNSTSTDTSLKIEWNSPDNVPDYANDTNNLEVNEYWLYRSTINLTDNTENTMDKIKELSGNILEYIDTSLSYGTLYKYYIRAVRKRIGSFIPGEIEPDTETILEDELIEGLLSDGVEGYVFQHNAVSNEQPNIIYNPEVDKQLVNINVEQPSSLTIQENIIDNYFIEYDISYNYKNIDRTIVSSSFTLRKNTIPETLNDILTELLDNELDLSMNFGQTLNLQFKIRQIYKTNEYESLWSNVLKTTPYSTPDSPLNLQYSPDLDNDKQFNLSWNPIIYDPSYDAPYTSLIKYKVYFQNPQNIYEEIETIDTDNTSILISTADLSMNYNEIYNFKVEAYLPPQSETSVGGKTLDPTDAISDITSQTELDVFIFEYVTIPHPTTVHELTIDSTDININIETPLKYKYTNDKYVSYYDISSSFTIQDIQRDFSSNISTDSSNTIIPVSNITFGDTFNYQIKIVQLYRNFTFETSYYNLNNVTTYSTPSAVSGLHIRSVTDDGQNPLSTSLQDGRLKLSWDHISYDKVNGIDGKYSNNIKYKILSYSQTGPTSTYTEFSDNLNNTYEDISDNYVILHDLSLGHIYSLGKLRIQAYYNNTELNNGIIVGEISGDRNSITTLLEKTIISDSKNVIYGNTGFIYNTSSSNNSDVNLELFSNNRENIMSNVSSLNNVTLQDLSSIIFDITDIRGQGGEYLYIVINTTNGNSLHVRSTDSDNPYGKITILNKSIQLLYTNLSNLNDSNSNSIINDDITHNDIITSIELRTENITSFTLHSLTLDLINDTKVLSFIEFELRNLSNTSIYNEILNKPFYYPDNVENLYVDKNSVTIINSNHNIPLNWDSLSNNSLDISSNGGLPENIEYRINVSAINITGNYKNTIYVDGVDSSFFNIVDNTLDQLYKINITSLIRYNGEIILNEQLSVSSFIYYMLPSILTNLQTSETNQELILSWDHHNKKDVTGNTDLSFIQYEYRYIDGITEETFTTHDNKSIITDLSNGITYTITVRSKYNYTNSDGYSEDYYSFDISKSLYVENAASGTTPFFKPIINPDDVDLSGTNLTIKVNNNGRPIREFLLVYIPFDDNAGGDILIDASSNINNFSAITPKPNSRTYNIIETINIENEKDSNRNISITTPYLCKYVLIVFENLAGSTVLLKNQAYP